MSGPIEFEYNDQDYVNAARTHTGRVSAIISSVFLALAALNAALDWRMGVPVTGDMLFWLSIGLFIFFLAWDWLRDAMIRRNFRQSLPMRSLVRLSWDENAITFDTDLSHAVYPWTDLFRWMGSSTSLLLYRDSSFFFPVPRRALPDGAFDEMVVLLCSAGVREKGKRQSVQSSPISS